MSCTGFITVPSFLLLVLYHIFFRTKLTLILAHLRELDENITNKIYFVAVLLVKVIDDLLIYVLQTK